MESLQSYRSAFRNLESIVVGIKRNYRLQYFGEIPTPLLIQRAAALFAQWLNRKTYALPYPIPSIQLDIHRTYGTWWVDPNSFSKRTYFPSKSRHKFAMGDTANQRFSSRAGRTAPYMQIEHHYYFAAKVRQRVDIALNVAVAMENNSVSMLGPAENGVDINS